MVITQLQLYSISTTRMRDVYSDFGLKQQNKINNLKKMNQKKKNDHQN